MTAITLKTAAAPAVRPTAVDRSGLRRAFAHHWDLFAVLTLLGSSGVYGLYTIAHLV